MVWQRIWNWWQTSAPITLILFSWVVEPFLERPGEKVEELLTTGLVSFNYMGLSNLSSASDADFETTKESAKVIFTGLYFFCFIALYLDWLTGNYISKVIYVTVIPALGAFMKFPIRLVERGRFEQNDENHTESSVDIVTNKHNRDLYTMNLKIASDTLIFVGTIIPILIILISALFRPTILGIYLFDIARVTILLLVLVFLPYFIDVFMLISAAMAGFALIFVMIVTMIFVSEFFGPYAACIVLLTVYGLYAVSAIIDPIISFFRFTKRFSGKMSNMG